MAYALFEMMFLVHEQLKVRKHVNSLNKFLQ